MPLPSDNELGITEQDTAMVTKGKSMNAKLAAKLVAAMKNIGVVEKRGNNTKQNYKFVKATDVANEVREAMTEAGIAFTFDVESERFWEKPTSSGGMLFYCSLSVRGTFIDSESGETLSGRAIGWGSDSLDKAPYKAMTGALKYILRMNFLIPDEEDAENDNDHYEQRPATVSTPKTPPHDAAPTQDDGAPGVDVFDVLEKAGSKGPYLIVLDAERKSLGSVFDVKLFNAVKASKGHRVEFISTKNGAYTNISGIASINGVQTEPF